MITYNNLIHRLNMLNFASKDNLQQFQDTSKFNILYNDNKWILVQPLNWEACVYIDSFKCGGQGAKWCIGYKKEDEYYSTYTKKNDLFCLIYRLGQQKDNCKKYMVQLTKTKSCKVWTQDDEPKNTFMLSDNKAKKLFGDNLISIISNRNNYKDTKKLLTEERIIYI